MAPPSSGRSKLGKIQIRQTTSAGSRLSATSEWIDRSSYPDLVTANQDDYRARHWIIPWNEGVSENVRTNHPA